MNIVRKQEIVDGDYRVIIYVEDLSQEDTNGLLQFGDLEIATGGTFTGPPELTISVGQHVVYRGDGPGTPLVYAVSLTDHADADERCVVWGDEIVVRIKAAVDALRALIAAEAYISFTTESY